MICPELLSAKPDASIGVDLNRYYELHHDGRRLIHDWYQRGWNMRDSKGVECFEAFIFTWLAVNGWAACVTNTDSDRKYLDALIQDSEMSRRFEILLRSETSQFSQSAKQFVELWTIFKTARLRELRIIQWEEQDARPWERRERGEIVRNYLCSGADKYEPQCFANHNSSNPIPLDWPHTIATIYRVRCNLFHGDKSARSEMNIQIVSTAFLTLLYYFREAEYL